MDKTCAACGGDMYRKEAWEKRGKRRICMNCGPAGYRFDAKGGVLLPETSKR